jgi:hypothetical protein
MRASPAFQLTIERFGAWRAALACVALGTVAALAAWALSDLPAGLRLAGVAAGLVLLWQALPLARVPAASLRWDTRCWHLGPAATRGEEPWQGTLVVALDLGSWMLLKFVHEVTPGGSRTSWLPVQRRGLEAHWHALRCAVYCARPAPRRDATRSAAKPENDNNERP